MLYHLLFPLSETLSIFNVFRYITFRTGGAVVTALVLSIVLGPWFISTLRRLSVGQNIRDVGPESHLLKAGTPTMGGLLILFSMTTATLLWANLSNILVWVALGSRCRSAPSASPTTTSRWRRNEISAFRRGQSSWVKPWRPVWRPWCS